MRQMSSFKANSGPANKLKFNKLDTSKGLRRQADLQE
jgi:hypothetical protein